MIKDRFRKILKLDYLQKQLRRKTKTKKKKNVKAKKLFISLLNAESTTNLMVQIKSQMD